MKIISRTIWVLSLVSFFTDMASEMLYPIMPLFLKQAGYTALFIGILEAVAEATAGFSKTYFGKLSDRSGKRLPFVQLGYALSAISKPMLALLVHPLWILLSRTTDRLGKGIRTGARDALLRDESTAATRSRVFGFHRSIDTLGAVAGPAIALLYLYFNPGAYKTLFLLAFLPGLAAIFLTLLVKPKTILPVTREPARFFAFFSYWRNCPVSYKKLLIGLILFALVNSSDVFLLLRMKEVGIADPMIITLYILYNLVYALCAYPLGKFADKFGPKKILVAGLLLFSIVYGGFSFAQELWQFAVLLMLYGLYAAATEGIAKAWISNITPPHQAATALGTYSGFQSIAALFASSVAGLTWVYFGAPFTFLTAAFVTIVAAVYLFFTPIALQEPH